MSAYVLVSLLRFKFLNLLFGKEALVMRNPGLHFTRQGLGNYYKYLMSDIVIQHQDNKIWVVIFICVSVLVFIILKNLFLYISRFTLHPLRNGIVRKLRAEMFEKIMNLPIGFFTNERKGDVMARMTNDIGAVEESIVSVMDLLFSAPITIIFYLAILITLSPKLCIFLFIFLPLAGWIIGRISKNLKSQSTNNSIRVGNLLSILDETLGGLRIIKGFSAEKIQQLKFTHENNYLNKLNNPLLLSSF